PDRQAGRELLEQTIVLARRVGDSHHLARALRFLARDLAHAGRADEAEQALEELVAALDRGPTELRLGLGGYVVILRAKIAFVRGQLEAADAGFVEGAAIAKRLGRGQIGVPGTAEWPGAVA